MAAGALLLEDDCAAPFLGGPQCGGF